MMENPHVFLDIDIDDAREAYKRCAAFVEATDLRYGFSSKDISLLGGRELQSVEDFYCNDFDWSQKGTIRVKPQEACRIIVKLFPEAAPLAVENFMALCTGSQGCAKGSGVPLHYKGCKFHRVVPGFVAQGGDFVFENGTGGESIWGKKFKDERGGLRLRHDKPGILSMGNSGKNSNGSQFFFTFAALPQLDGKHVVFGEVISGFEVLTMMEALGTSSGEPIKDIKITEAGIWSLDMLAQGYWDPDGTFKETKEKGLVEEEKNEGNRESSNENLRILVYVPKTVIGEKFRKCLPGYNVTSTVSISECHHYISGSLFNLILVGQSVLEQEKEQIMEMAQPFGIPVLSCRPVDALQAVEGLKLSNITS